jgi:hypothetical protein
MNKIFLILILLKSFATNASLMQKYDLQKNINLSFFSDPNFLIQKSIRIDRISCLVECNLNEECFTALYIPNSLSNDNCFKYRKYFTSSEKFSSLYSDLYEKPCK